MKMERILTERGHKDHAVQKIFREKKTMEDFKSEFEFLDKKFHISVPGMFSPKKDIFVTAVNDNEFINRYICLFDKETGVYEFNSLEGEKGNYKTNKTIDNKSYTEIKKYYYNKLDTVLYPPEERGED